MRLRWADWQQRQLRTRRETLDLGKGHPLEVVEGGSSALAHDPANPITSSTLGSYSGLSNGRPSQNNVAFPRRPTIWFRAMFHPF